MNYQSYEDYMRSVLGYSPFTSNNYTYQEPEDNYEYSNIVPTQPTQDLTPFYPEIYKMIYPMVCKICNTNSNRELTKELLEQMTNEVYINVEPEDKPIQTSRIPLKNGDVRNPNAKEPEQTGKETRQTNFLLRDLIRILLLREWGRPPRPPFPPAGRPPRPGRPPMGPPPRPRGYNGMY
ncbi:MAG: hypothetical protein Q4G09_00015 [Clostridia bacterium]|nr:hypothetical protein [Clostridia bacterium]